MTFRMKNILPLLSHITILNMSFQLWAFNHQNLFINYILNITTILKWCISSSSDLSLLNSISPYTFIIIIYLFGYFEVICQFLKHLKHLISRLRLVWVLVLPFYLMAESLLNVLRVLNFLLMTLNFNGITPSLL